VGVASRHLEKILLLSNAGKNNGVTQRSRKQANLWASWQNIVGLNVCTNVPVRASKLKVLDATFESFLCHKPRRTFNQLLHCVGDGRSSG